MRPSGRSAEQVRPIKITRHYTKHAEGSVLVEFGETKVLCNATIEESVPRFLKGQNQGWVTALMRSSAASDVYKRQLLNMVCCRELPIQEPNVKRQKENKQAVRWKSNALLPVHYAQ